MATDRVLCSKPCYLQHADKSTTDGMLYVYQTVVRFVPTGGSNQQRLEIAVSDIKAQKRSKSNPLVLVETTKGKPVFGFSSQQERDEVTTAIATAQKVLQTAGEAAGAATSALAKAPAEAAAAAAAVAAGGQTAAQLAQQLSTEQRKELLASSPALAAQHKTLVVDSKALTDDEFWSSTAVQKAAGLAGMPTTTPRASKRGLANKLVDLARQFQTAGDARAATVELSAEDEQQLLAEKPALKQLYDAQVGPIMTRAEFWQRYFRYYMAKHMRRGGAVRKYKELQANLMANSAAAVAGMTGDMQQEATDQEMADIFAALDNSNGLDGTARKALQRRLNPVLDLAAAAEDRLTADGYGLAHNAARSETEQVQGYSALSRQLVQDYNIHAAAVIGHDAAAAANASSVPSSSTTSGPAAIGRAAPASTQNLSEMSEGELQHFKQQTGSKLDDLMTPEQQQYEELHVTNPRLYFSHINKQQQPVVQQQQQQQQHPHVKQEPGVEQEPQAQDIIQLLHSIDPYALSERPMHPQAAYKVLHDLCGGDEADAARRGGVQKLPDDQKIVMQRQAMLVDELLRHFWAQIPVNNHAKEAKIKRIQESLNLVGDQLKNMEADCPPGYKALLTRLTKPLWAQLDVATNAYKAVQQALKSKQQQQQRPRKPS